jgi:hypothetical protein
LEDTAKPGESVVAQKGDVLRVDKGASVKWSSPSSGTGTLPLTDRICEHNNLAELDFERRLLGFPDSFWR